MAPCGSYYRAWSAPPGQWAALFGLEQTIQEGELLSERRAIDSDKDRGDISQEGYGEAESRQPIKDTRTRPDLADPAEEEMNPPTHPTRDDGLGQKDTGEPSGDRPVPPGDPKTEPGRSDVQ